MSYKKTLKNINEFFPLQAGNMELPRLIQKGQVAFEENSPKTDSPWIKTNKSQNKHFIDNLSHIPEEGLESNEVIVESVKYFFNNIPNWRSPELQYNICAPVNVVAGTLMSLSQEYNIHNINNNFSGDCLLAEKTISNMMADLIDLDANKVKAIFSFGGTASNLYGMKLAIHKSFPKTGTKGINKNTYVMITEGAHFSHKTAADWLGIGTDQVITISQNLDCKSNILDAKEKAQKIIKAGGKIAGFLLNGGTLYDTAVDDIQEFDDLRRELVTKFNLDYLPHIHVDSVIGWIWLMFNKYNFEKNPLEIPENELKKIEKQFKNIYKIRLAD
ncbi:MAG: pyridoxal-dependent decarboxylase, partial [Candidatus Woesearchaeota archaeon]